jgi:hypothetical protein
MIQVDYFQRKNFRVDYKGETHFSIEFDTTDKTAQVGAIKGAFLTHEELVELRNWLNGIDLDALE